VADAIRSYLINLGFKLDEPGLRKFNEQIVKTHHVVRDFSVAFAGFAIGIEEAIRRTARQFENLFYLSQQTGISVSNLKSINFAVGQIGLSASAVDQALSSMTLSFIKNPGLVGFVNQYVPGFKDAEQATEGLARHLRGLIDNFGRYSPQVAQFANTIEAMGADFGMVFQRALNVKEFDAWKQRSKEVLQTLLPIGTTADKIAKQAVDAMNEWRFTWHITDVGLERLISATFPAFTRILQTFNAWLMKGETVQAFENIAKSIEEWVKKEENIKSVEDTLKTVGRAAKILAEGVWEVVKGFVWLSDNTNPLTAVVVAFFVAITTRAAAAAAAVGLMNAAIYGTGAAIKGVSTLVLGLGPLAGFLWGMWPGTAGGADEDKGVRRSPGAPRLAPPGSQGEADRQRQEQLDREKREGPSWWDRFREFRDRNRQEYLRNNGGPDTVEGGPAPIPGARKSSFGGDESGITSTSEALFNMFGAWFKGDTAFRPIVVIADEYYQKLVDALRNMTGITSGGGIGPGGTGAGGTNTPGHGRGFSTSGGTGGPVDMTGTGEGHVATKEERIAYYREQVKKYGLNAEAIIQTVAKEGLHKYVGDNGKSFGDFQLFTGGGMGNQAEQAGINIRDPNTWKRQADFVFGQMAQHKGDAAWFGSQWHGPRNFAPWAVQNFGNPNAVPPGGIDQGGAKWRTQEEIDRGVKPGQGAGEGKISGLRPEFRENLDRAMAAAKKATGDWLDIVSGYRDPEHQRRLFEASDKSGHMVARPGHSFHEKGLAADLGEGGALARHKDRPALKWLHEHAEEFGLQFPMDWEPWHIEPMGTRGGRRGGLGNQTNNNIDSDHNTTINIHGSTDPQGTARAVADLQDRRSMLHARNLRTSIA
jgi:hypothetical protein